MDYRFSLKPMSPERPSDHAHTSCLRVDTDLAILGLVIFICVLLHLVSMAVAACPLQPWMDDPKRSSAFDDWRTDFPPILVLLLHYLSFSTQELFDP
jgi:hypothetical protein